MIEADTCREYVIPKLVAAGWDDEPHSLIGQKTFTDGRIVLAGAKTLRRPQKRADYLLRYTRDLTLAVVEAKREYKSPGEGLQQAKDYAEVLDLKFAYSTNGHGIVEFDYLTGREQDIDTFPRADELWQRLASQEGFSPSVAEHLLAPENHVAGRLPRYYQQVAITRAVQAIAGGRNRALLTLATGTGKTDVAFQICWKLWTSRWNRTGEHRRPKILYLADRNILIDDPKDKTFAPFGPARWKIENGVANLGHEMYFAIYQAIAHDERRPGLYREYPPGFFDLIIVDECHRGSARQESSWREILEYFAPAAQLGMTATPLRDDNVDTYEYFGPPIYQYSLRQGIEDGFLAPYRVHRIVTTWDAVGWRPTQGEIDRYGQTIPDEEYTTQNFEKVIALRARTEAVARHLSDHLRRTDRMAKTIVFCVDQEHALAMRQALTNANSDLVQKYPDFVCRVTANEGHIGLGHLAHFQDVERSSPVILTTSQLLTTGVDMPTCKNVVLVRNVGSMTEFKQIIGRGTRVRPDYGKLSFTILDYTGSATRLFADPEFDGDPATWLDVKLGEAGEVESSTTIVEEESSPEDSLETGEHADELRPEGAYRKFYVDDGFVEIIADLVYELDSEGKRLRVVRLTDYAAEQVRTLFRSAAELRTEWGDPTLRATIISRLEERGITFEELATATVQPDADPFDLLCYLAYSLPLRTRRERADRLKKDERAFLERYGSEAREVLDELLEKYARYGTAQFALPDVLQLPPISNHGNATEIARLFGGPEALRGAVTELQTLIYVA